jgi:hypothetical protein
MKLSSDEFEETVGVARNYLQASALEPLPVARLARNFAEAIVKLADCCVIGMPCEKHGGAVHGQEAEELRAGVEQILKNTSGVRDDEAAFVLAEQRKALIFLLDRIDARDSFAFLEATDPSEESAPDRT